MQREGAGRRSAEVPEVEAALDELYTTPPSDFVAARERHVAAAKAKGREDGARLIHGARRPTLAAWAANLLLRSRPEESRQFLALGEALRDAYRTLDPAGLKELSDQRRRVVAALSAQAAELAREAGHRLSGSVRQEVESTLRAVLADADAADRWAAGRLETALAPPSGFSSDAVSAAAPPKPKRPATPEPSTRGQAKKDELAERRRERQERRQRLAAAREAAEAAEERLRAERAEAAGADAALERARERRAEAEQRVAAAEQQLQQAREGLERADREQRQAEERRGTAADAVARAELEAGRAAQEVRRLSGSRGGR